MGPYGVNMNGGPFHWVPESQQTSFGAEADAGRASTLTEILEARSENSAGGYVGMSNLLGGPPNGWCSFLVLF